MLAESSISVTDHALLRWNERVSETGNCHVDEIVHAIKKSKIIKKNEPVPFVTNRRNNTVYTFNGQVLFILDPISIDEFKLITVITDNNQSVPETYEPKTIVEEGPMFHDEPVFKTRLEEYEWLIHKKRQTELELSQTTKGSLKRNQIIDFIKKLEDRIFKNKSLKIGASLAPKETSPRDFSRDIDAIFDQLKNLNSKIDKLISHHENFGDNILHLKTN